MLSKPHNGPPRSRSAFIAAFVVLPLAVPLNCVALTGENLGGFILEQPSCVSWGGDRIDCFARGTDRAMYHRGRDGSSSWGGWEPLGGTLMEQPSCVSWGSNRIDCFARFPDGAMHHRWWDGHAWGPSGP